MRAILLIGTLALMAACAEQTTYQAAAPTGGTAGAGGGGAPAQSYPCNRSDYADGPAGDADYTNCVIQS